MNFNFQIIMNYEILLANSWVKCTSKCKMTMSPSIIMKCQTEYCDSSHRCTYLTVFCCFFPVRYLFLQYVLVFQTFCIDYKEHICNNVASCFFRTYYHGIYVIYSVSHTICSYAFIMYESAMKVNAFAPFEIWPDFHTLMTWDQQS